MKKFLMKTSAMVVSAIMAASLFFVPVMAEEGDLAAEVTEVVEFDSVIDVEETTEVEEIVEEDETTEVEEVVEVVEDNEAAEPTDDEFVSYLTDFVLTGVAESTKDLLYADFDEDVEIEDIEGDFTVEDPALAATVVDNLTTIKNYVKANGKANSTGTTYTYDMTISDGIAVFTYFTSSDRLQFNFITINADGTAYEAAFFLNCKNGVIVSNTSQVWYYPDPKKSYVNVAGRTKAFNNAAYKSNTTLTDFTEYSNSNKIEYNVNEMNENYNMQIHRTVSGLNAVLKKQFNMTVKDVGFSVYTEPNKSKIKSFVKRIYTDCLNRTPEAAGVEYWTEQLMYGKKDGASVGAGFVFSAEYWNKGVTRKEYVKMLYKVFMGREADEAGLAYWLDNMANGMTREQVFKGFVDSAEYTSICKSYGITRGNYKLQGIKDPAVKNKKVTTSTKKFVERIYTKALGRSGDASGINYWAQEIANENRTPVQVAESFIFSAEFTNKKLSNTDYIKVLYRTFMGREADKAGLNYWLGRMKAGDDRKTVLEAFAACDEFKTIVKSFGL